MKLARYGRRFSRAAELYTPKDDGRLDPSEPFTELEFGGTVRRVSTAILSTMLHFNSRGVVKNYWLMHDCSVAALSFQTGETFEGVRFFGRNQPYVDTDEGNSWTRAEMTSLTDADSIPPTQVGDALMTMQLDRRGRRRPHAHHVFVRVSEEDGHNPLFASRVGPVGAAVLHTIEGIRKYYPADVVVPVQLCVVDPLHAPIPQSVGVGTIV